MASSAEPRHMVRLRVELTGSDGCGNRFKQTAFTHNVSLRGARVTQAPSFLCPAAEIEVKYRGRSSRFRVVWVGDITNEIGLRALDPERCLWGVPLPGRRIYSVPPSPVIAARVAVPSRPVASTPSPGRGDLTDGRTEPISKSFGYFCKDAQCQKKRAFHRFPDGTIVWDIWPQKFECPVSGRRHEYSKGEVRSAGYA